MTLAYALMAISIIVITGIIIFTSKKIQKKKDELNELNH